MLVTLPLYSMGIWGLPKIPRTLQKSRNLNDISMCKNFPQFRFSILPTGCDWATANSGAWPFSAPLVSDVRRRNFFLPVLLKIYCRLFFANQKLDSAESEIDGIVMQNKGIKQRGVMALFAEGAVVNGKWADTSPCSNHLSARPKTIQLFLTPDPPCQTDSAFWKFISSYQRFNLSQ